MVETVATDGKVLRGPHGRGRDEPEVNSHPAIMLVSAYIVERGLILEPYKVNSKTNEITALPTFIKQIALQGMVFAFDAISTPKNSSDNHREQQRLFRRIQGQPIRLIESRKNALSRHNRASSRLTRGTSVLSAGLASIIISKGCLSLQDCGH